MQGLGHGCPWGAGSAEREGAVDLRVYGVWNRVEGIGSRKGAGHGWG